ncbi:hypothetical protein CTAYLR_004850, partial [Chrysophaeum taylorii]
SKSQLHGWVAGSEITTLGLAKALRRRSDVQHVEIFAPFAYGGLAKRQWDILLIEGYSGPATRVIREVRRANGLARVLHWCLDTYPALRAVAALPVDGFITNSRLLASRGFEKAAEILGETASPWYAVADALPRAFVALGVDPELRSDQPPFFFFEPGLVVYLGQPSPTKRILVPALLRISEVPGVRLEIYGTAWDRVDTPLRRYWRGPLPSDQIFSLYARAAVVIGTTESAQRRLGMVNNRVFEAIATARAFVAVEEAIDDELERILGGDAIATTPETAAAAVARALNSSSCSSWGPRSAVDDVHSYARRADTILNFARRTTPRRERIVAIYDSRDKDLEWWFAYVPALSRLGVTFVDGRNTPPEAAWCVGAALVISRGEIAKNFPCETASGGRGEPRDLPKLLLGDSCDPAFDVVVRYAPRYSNNPCAALHPNARTVLGLDLDALRPPPESGRRREKLGPTFFDPPRPEALPDLLWTVAQVEATTPFTLLAALAAGAVATVFNNTDLADLLADATSGGEPHFRAAYSLDVLIADLRDAVDAALDPPRAAAAVAIIEPTNAIPCATTNNERRVVCRFETIVALTAFVTPDDGVWCVRVNGVELACQGDTKDVLDTSFEYVLLCSEPRTHPW